MSVEIAQSTIGDAYLMAPHMRANDAREVMASSGVKPLEALTLSVAASVPHLCWTAFIDGEPGVMFGVSPTPDPDVGIAWLLATDAMYKYRKMFFIKSLEYISEMHESYPTLLNYVDARNTDTRRWLKRAGFEELTTIDEYGYEHLPFILISKYKDGTNV